jgi:hypothetical protein
MTAHSMHSPNKTRGVAAIEDSDLLWRTADYLSAANPLECYRLLLAVGPSEKYLWTTAIAIQRWSAMPMFAGKLGSGCSRVRSGCSTLSSGCSLCAYRLLPS